MRKLDPTTVNFDNATSVISGAMKFTVPVPNAAGQPLVNPDGSPIANWKGEPKYAEGTTGFLFHNPKDQSLQGTLTDGTTMVIINEVTEEQANLLYAKVDELGGPNGLSLDGLKAFLAYAASIGLVDQYDSDEKFFEKNLSAVKKDDPQVQTRYGWVKRDERDICHAVYRGWSR